LITSSQIRAARALLDWTVQNLADKSSLGFTTVVRMESGNGVPPSQAKTLDSVQRALERAGIEFIGTPDDRPGVRLNISNKD
jgi:transcriptional regulator with XRE-family HTH domain